MAITLDDIWTVSEGDVDVGAIACDKYLDSGELLNAVSSVTEVGSSDLTLDQEAVSTAALTIKERSVAIGEAVQFRFQGQQSGTTYTIRVTVTTDAGRTKVFDQTMVCV